VYGVAFSASAPRMATCCKDGTVALWNIDVRYQSGEDPKLVSRWETQQPGGQAYQHVAVSPDAQFVAASCQSSIDVFDSAGQLVDRIEDAHVGEVAELAFSGTLKVTAGQPHKHLLASRGNDKRVRLWRCGA